MGAIASLLVKQRIVALEAEVVANYPIYGAYWTKGSSPTLTRTHSAVGLTSAVGLDGAWVTNSFDSAQIFRDMSEVTDTYGNKFIRIPKCYIKKTDGVGYKTWQVSKTQYPGFYRPACFWNFTTGKELPYVDVGKHKATKDGGNKLESKTGLYPLVLDHIVNFRTFAKANNTGGLLGYQQLDVHVVDLLRTLMFIEFATLDLQTVMYGFANGKYLATHVATDAENTVNRIIVDNAFGATYRVGQTISIGSALGNNSVFYGRTITAIAADTPAAGKTAVTFDGATVNIAVNNVLYNTGWKNGFSSAIAASSGSLVSNSTGLYPCVYRGIESLFGDIDQWIDGININEYQAWVCANADDYASNVFAAPYKQLGYVNYSADNGWPVTMGHDANYPYANFPTSVGGSSSTYYSDHYVRAAGEKVARFGGPWTFGAYVGPSFWYLNSLSSATLVSIGGRLCRKCL